MFMIQPPEKNIKEMRRDYGCVTNLGGMVAAVRTAAVSTAKRFQFACFSSHLHVFSPGI